jgi:hypothetical protein
VRTGRVLLGVVPSSTLEVQISTPNGEPVFASSAQTTIVNDQPVRGRSAGPAIATLAEVGTFSQSGSAYTLDLGTLTQGQALPALGFAIENVANAPADELAGTFSTVGTGAFTVTGNGPLVPIAAEGSYNGLSVTVDTTETGT